MKLRTRLPAALFAVLALMLVSACSSAGLGLANSSTSTNRSSSHFTADTKLDVIELEVRPAMRSNRLEIKQVRLDAGTVTARLSTPDGQVQWEKTFTAPDTSRQTLSLDAVPGTWKLELQLENATGAYQVQWRASN